MTRDDIIRMAREAGWKDLRDYDSEMHNDIFMGNTDSLKAFAELVRADEREVCAKVCEEHWEIDGTRTAKEFANAIRARGQS